MDQTLLQVNRIETKRHLARLLKEQMRRKGLSDLHFFSKEICGYKDLTDKEGFHGEYCRHLENEKYNFKLTLTPRGSLKTSIGSVALPLQQIVKNPNIRILMGSEKYTKSTAWLTELKGHIEKNETFKDLYGDLKGDVWNKGEIIVKSRTTWKASPTIMCAGIDVTMVGMHYDMIIVDDPHSEQNTTSIEQINKVIRWYKLLLSLLDPGGYLNVTGTIWHYADLYNHIIMKERDRLQAGYKKRFKIFKRDSFEGTNDDLLNDRIPREGYLWPERLSNEFLVDQLLEQGPYMFSCQYRLNPIDDDTAVFKKSWIKTCGLDEIPSRLNIYSTIDPMRDEEGKDFLSITTVGMDDKWRGYILDQVRVKADEHDTLDWMYKVYNKFHPIKMGMEVVAWQKTYYQYNKILQIMRGKKLPVTPLETSTRVTKGMRIRSMVPYWKSGLYIVPCKNGDLRTLKGGMATLVDELTRYPKTANDDCIDSLAYMNQLTKRPGVIQILKKIPEGSFASIRAKIISSKNHNKLGSNNVRRPYVN